MLNKLISLLSSPNIADEKVNWHQAAQLHQYYRATFMLLQLRVWPQEKITVPKSSCYSFLLFLCTTSQLIQKNNKSSRL